MTKYVKENEYLLSKNTIKINDKKTTDYTITDYLIQRPNNRALTMPVGLLIYNLGNLNYDSIHQQKLKDFVHTLDESDGMKRKKAKTAKDPQLDQAMFNWFLKNIMSLI